MFEMTKRRFVLIVATIILSYCVQVNSSSIRIKRQSVLDQSTVLANNTSVVNSTTMMTTISSRNVTTISTTTNSQQTTNNNQTGSTTSNTTVDGTTVPYTSGVNASTGFTTLAPQIGNDPINPTTLTTGNTATPPVLKTTSAPTRKIFTIDSPPDSPDSTTRKVFTIDSPKTTPRMVSTATTGSNVGGNDSTTSSGVHNTTIAAGSTTESPSSMHPNTVSTVTVNMTTGKSQTTAVPTLEQQTTTLGGANNTLVRGQEGKILGLERDEFIIAASTLGSLLVLILIIVIVMLIVRRYCKKKRKRSKSVYDEDFKIGELTNIRNNYEFLNKTYDIPTPSEVSISFNSLDRISSKSSALPLDRRMNQTPQTFRLGSPKKRKNEKRIKDVGDVGEIFNNEKDRDIETGERLDIESLQQTDSITKTDQWISNLEKNLPPVTMDLDKETDIIANNNLLNPENAKNVSDTETQTQPIEKQSKVANTETKHGNKKPKNSIATIRRSTSNIRPGVEPKTFIMVDMPIAPKLPPKVGIDKRPISYPEKVPEEQIYENVAYSPQPKAEEPLYDIAAGSDTTHDIPKSDVTEDSDVTSDDVTVKSDIEPVYDTTTPLLDDNDTIDNIHVEEEQDNLLYENVPNHSRDSGIEISSAEGGNDITINVIQDELPDPPTEVLTDRTQGTIKRQSLPLKIVDPVLEQVPKDDIIIDNDNKMCTDKENIPLETETSESGENMEGGNIVNRSDISTSDVDKIRNELKKANIVTEASDDSVLKFKGDMNKGTSEC